MSGRYSVSITLHSYSNLQHTCVRCNTYCCDERRTGECTGSSRCDTLFSFCLVREGSFSSNPPIRCNGPSTNTDTQSNSDGTINFALGAVLGITNPFVLDGISNLWTVS